MKGAIELLFLLYASFWLISGSGLCLGYACIARRVHLELLDAIKRMF